MRKILAFVLSLFVTSTLVYSLAKANGWLIFLPAIYGVALTFHRLRQWRRKNNNRPQKENVQIPLNSETNIEPKSEATSQNKQPNNLNPFKEPKRLTQVMNYDPFSKKLASLEKAISDSAFKARHLRTQLDWYQKNDIADLQDRLASHRLLLEKASNNKVLEDRRIEITLIQIHGLSEKLMSPRNPFGWFNTRQTELRTELDLLNRRLQEQRKQNGAFIRAQAENNHAISQIEKAIKQHKLLDKTQIHDEIHKIHADLKEMEQEYKKLYEKNTAAAEVLNPLIQQIQECETQIAQATEIINWAKKIAQRLNRAANSNERYWIREECKTRTGQVNPQYVIDKQVRLVERLERDVNKLHKRALELSERLALDIRTIVIDGNNLCYEDGDFVGLSPLLKLTKSLADKMDISLIFDASIRGLLNMGHDTIRKQFNEKVKVHVVATRQKADETLLSVASNDPIAFVISNDRFVDFKDSDVVKNNRLIRHEIFAGSLMIHDLNVNVNYRLKRGSHAHHQQ